MCLFVSTCNPVSPLQVACTDLLVPGMGELIGGSAREDDYEALLARMTHDGLDAGAYDWYLDLRRYETQRRAWVFFTTKLLFFTRECR